MMNLIITVMAIALAALLTVGGIHYFDGGSGPRILVSRSFETQLDAIGIAVSAYKASNNGLSPPIDADPAKTVEQDARINGFLPWGKLPPSPRAAEGFRWTRISFDGRPSMCLSNPVPVDAHVRDATIRFAANQVGRRRQQGETYAGGLEVVLVEDCASGPSEPEAPFEAMIEQAKAWNTIAVIIRER